MTHTSEDAPLGKALNVFGAGASVLSDQFRGAINDALGTAGESSAAIIMIGSHPGMPVGEIARSLNLSQSGCVRLIDRLEIDGFVRRGGSKSNHRIVTVSLTSEGEKKRLLALRQRERSLRQALGGFTDEEIRLLGGMMERVLRNLLTTKVSECYNFCRMCNEETCVPNGCPVELRWAELNA